MSEDENMSKVPCGDSSQGEGEKYKIGFRHPPEATRFKPGQSGNPRGRPRVNKTFGRALEAALQRKIDVTTDKGVKRKMTANDALAHGIVTDALRRRPTMMKLLLDSMATFIDNGGDAAQHDRDAIEAAEAKATLRAKLDEMARRYQEQQEKDGPPKE